MKSKKTEQHLKKLIEGRISGEVINSLSLLDTDFKILYQDKITQNIFGDHVGTYCYEAYECRDNTCEDCPLEKTFKNGGTHTALRSLVYSNGVLEFEITASPLRDSTGKIIAGIEVVRNITTCKGEEKILLQSNKDYSAINDMITVHDKDFNIICANKEAQKILGLPRLEFTKVKCYEYYHGKDCPPKGCPSCRCLLTGESVTFKMFEPHLRRFIKIRAFPRFDSNHEFIGLIHFVKDVSDQRLK
ncbi:MAG: PAS domain-containing protein [Thermodesulfovibrionia bacterium]|nr:PAS domain-containing protein [Thermodesulfovibrionia bacterium]